jgi:hypothetical protein
MVTVSEPTEKERRKQKGSVNATVRGNGLVNEVVTIVAEVEGRGTEETEKGREIVEGQIVIMTAEIAEGQWCIVYFLFIWKACWLKLSIWPEWVSPQNAGCF